MRIYTKRGDRGTTSLMGGARVAKDDPRVAAYGDVDEASACIGVARATPPRRFADPLLAAIQRDLFAIGGGLATPHPDRLRSPRRAKLTLGPDRIAALEAAIDDAERRLPALRAFVLPAGSRKAAALHLARTVCRRAERSAVRLARHEQVPAHTIVYLNRLSDLLFVLARLANRSAGTREVTW